MLRLSALILLCCLLPLASYSQYKVDGTLTDPSGTWGRIHLEYIPSIENLTHLMSQNVVAGSPLDSAGRFQLEGIGLPAGKHLYRVFLMKKSEGENGYGITNGRVRNFNLIVLDSNTHLTIRCSDISKSFDYCEFVNEPESRAIAQLFDQITKPILSELVKDSTQHPSELKVQLLSKRRNDLLMQFADTTQYIIPGLVALQLLPDFEAAFRENPRFFRRFSKKVTTKAPLSPYVIEFNTKVEALDRRHHGQPFDWTKPLLYLFMALSAGLLVVVVWQQARWKKHRQATAPQAVPDRAMLESLSPKELEVLQLLADGKSNKEIAQALFIETSTVKSHVNKIYQKLGLTTRQEARQWLDLLGNP